MTKPMAKWVEFVWPADEEWRDVPGFPGYQVSRLGRARTLRTLPMRLLKGLPDKDGYLYVRLIRDGKYRKWHIHRLVAIGLSTKAHGATYEHSC